MSLFRSKKMGYFTLITSHEYAWETLNHLGQVDALQFIDLNADETSFHRPFSNYIKRCEDIDARLNTIEDYMNKFNQPIHRCEDPKEFLIHLRDTVKSRNKAEWTYLDDVEAEVEEKMSALTDQIKNYEELVENFNHLVEFREVLLKTKQYVTSNASLGNIPVSRDIKFNYMAGVINKEDSLRFRRLLFRITRGMTWTVLVDIEKPAQQKPQDNQNAEEQPEQPITNYFIDSAKEGAPKEKTVFLVVYQGGEHEMLKGKLNRICDSFGASKYGIPEDPAAFEKKLLEVEIQLKDAHSVLEVTRGHLQHVLHFFSEPRKEDYTYSHIEGLRLFVEKEKVLYHNLNLMKSQHALLRGECWCPLDRVQVVRDTLNELSKTKEGLGSCEFHESPPPAGVSPPTGFDLNDFTGVFQEIVNTYGIPRYREINPGLFTIATFPFLFGVMFGDIAHGFLLLCAGLYLVFWKESIEKSKDSLWHMALPARYLLAMQGFFALYCGLIYNDFTSFPFRLFTSCYDEDGGVKDTDCNYPLGIDPAWYHTSNELTFMNSFKMKLAIVLGVAQMLFGIVLRGINSASGKKWLDFVFEFIPMLIFMSATFGYMVVLIFLKWATPYGHGVAPSRAPSIINIFIKMALSPGKWDPAIGVPLYGDANGNTQAAVQLYLLLAALVCAVLILVPKPLILYFTHQQHLKKQEHTLKGSDYTRTENLMEQSSVEENQLLIEPVPEKQGDLMKKAEHGETQPLGEHFDMGEIFVHQIIETIEFVLGSISNTASYLRLWALSLAHSQLAKVFFTNSLVGPMGSGNFIIAFVAFWIFANITLAVLMLMDQMECFLHALRLHWVEFQNKFYKADGYAFVPLSFDRSLKAAK